MIRNLRIRETSNRLKICTWFFIAKLTKGSLKKRLESLQLQRALTCDEGPFAEYTGEALHVVEIVLCPSHDGARRDTVITSGAWREKSSQRRAIGLDWIELELHKSRSLASKRGLHLVLACRLKKSSLQYGWLFLR